MNKCFVDGVIPTAWKEGDLLLFNKVDKDRGPANSHRPTCLSPAWSKVLDKLVTNRLVIHSSSREFMNLGQFGFTPGMGTKDVLQKLRQTIEGCQNRARPPSECS